MLNMDLKEIYPPREKWTHKGKNGYLLVIAGSKKYTGSPIFNALAALRAGADLVCCLGPERAMNIAAQFLPDIITFPLVGDCLRKKHLPFILKQIPKFDSLVIGCGLGRSLETFQVVLEIIKKADLPMVVDADGIRAISQEKEKISSILKEKKIILTPHSKEFEILTGEKLTTEIEERKEKVKKWAKKLNCLILLKGHLDVISDGQEVFLNETGSPFMTKGGFGDILTGILGAILARKVNLFEAAKAASFINGKAGQLAAEKYGEGLLASDSFEIISQVIKNYAK